MDLDEAALERYLGQQWLADVANLPFANDTFDVACSEYMIEHLDAPEAVFAELGRVLRPGGAFVFLTPNRWSYKSIIAALTPHWFHRLAAAWLRPDARSSEDVYPTRYRANTMGRISELAWANGFHIHEMLRGNNGPTWFRRVPILFELGHWFHQALERFPWLGALRCSVEGVLIKTGCDVEVGEVKIRCTRCAGGAGSLPGSFPMTPDGDGFVCPVCARRYRRVGRVIVVVPKG